MEPEIAMTICPRCGFHAWAGRLRCPKCNEDLLKPIKPEQIKLLEVKNELE